MNKPNPTNRPGTTVATSFGLMQECGLTDTDVTPDEEDTPEGTKGEEFGNGSREPWDGSDGDDIEEDDEDSGSGRGYLQGDREV